MFIILSILHFYVSHEAIHFVVAILLAWLIFNWFHSKRAAVVCFSYSVLIDIDHLFDFFVYTKGVSFDIYSFFTTPYFLENGKAYVPLHGWEYAIILLILSVFLKKYRDIYVALSFAIIGHLLIDQFYYSMTPFKYFLVYRWIYGFGMEL